ncbi:MAG: hypothetical protein V1808_02445 [Candidatus Daviesbacteria bacterium]
MSIERRSKITESKEYPGTPGWKFNTATGNFEEIEVEKDKTIETPQKKS